MIDDSFQHPTIQNLPDGENEFIISTVATESSPSNDKMMDCSKQNQCSQVEAKNISNSSSDTHAQHRPCAQNTSDNMYHHSSLQQNMNIPGVYVQETSAVLNHPEDILNSIPDNSTNQKLSTNISTINDIKKQIEQNTTIKNKKKFMCDICGKSLSCQNSLREHHIVIHLKSGSFKCNTCKKGFPSAPALKKHAVSHTTEKKFTCDTCGSAHKRHSELVNHVTDMHVENNFLRCEVCFLNFKDKYTLKKHCFDDHGDTVTTCIICKNKLMTPLSIYCHCLKHSGARHFACDVCNRAFKTSSGLKAHRVQHDPDRKPYKDCDKCGKSFISRSSYYAHISSHDKGTGQTVTFTCYVCTTTFKHASSLKRHALRHRQAGGIQKPPDNPYLNMEESVLPKLCCGKCRKIYTSKSGYYSHIKVCRDGIVDSFKCDFCERSYTRRNALNRHLRINHPVVYANVLEGTNHDGDSAIVVPIDGSETVTIEIEPTIVEVPVNTPEEECNSRAEHLGEVQALFKVALAPVKENETAN